MQILQGELYLLLGNFRRYFMAAPLEIPNKAGVQSRILPVGVDATNELKTPQNIFDVGWYEGSAKPGSYYSALLLNGHVSGPTKPGFFAKLQKLAVGDIVTVECGDGQQFNYRVISKETDSAVCES
jgi:hypothetical protein